jgi:hypothetical protein
MGIYINDEVAYTHTFSRRVAGDLSDLALGWVLAKGAEKVSDLFAGDKPSSTLVEKSKSLLVL